MTIEKLARLVIEACQAENVEHMLTGALAHGLYGVPRSTRDVDIVVDFMGRDPLERIAQRLQGEVDFQEQVEFDTLTWGRRQIGYSRDSPPFVVELFELFDDPFVLEQFARRRPLHSRQLGVTTWVPSAEDIIVQKLRWGRPKDLEDARDVLTVQGPENLDMDYIARWCQTHGNSPRLAIAMDGL